jgi:hypothetical protein
MNWTADANPTKDFFIDMITRDIGLDECLFDLLDNCVDGAKRAIARSPRLTGQQYQGYKATLVIQKDGFVIQDNCGGIPLEDAKNYAFHFGKKRGDGQVTSNSIGLYGIGMKRAIFKIGEQVNIQSGTKETPAEAFQMEIDVPKWAALEEWDFQLEPIKEKGFVGTRISIKNLKQGVASEFSSEMFLSKLSRDISKYYSFILHDGFEIELNGTKILPFTFSLRSGAELKPIFETYVDEIQPNVTITIAAGLAGSPPDDPSNTDIRAVDAAYWGWFVICNDRVVLAADKTERTVWGGDFRLWHPQYNGFMGIVKFTCQDAAALPWTTTKREIDDTSPLYRRTLQKMRNATREYIEYTNARKPSIESAKQIEAGTVLTPVKDLAPLVKMIVPHFAKAATVAETTISYSRPKATVKKVAEALGNSYMTNKEVGLKTFQYFIENELGE